jgi:hypothetical protein
MSRRGFSRKIENNPTCLQGRSFRVVWDEATILEIESYSKYRRCKVCLTKLISLPSLYSSLIYIPLVSYEVTK